MNDQEQLQGKPWKVIKCWQSPDHELILQVSFAGIPARRAPVKKFHVIADSRQTSFGITVETEKPDFKPFTNPLINLWRKYCRSVLILDVTQDAASGNIYLQLHNTSEQEAKTWHLILSKSRPPEIALVDADLQVLVRHGMKGTFTKRRPLTEDLPVFAPFGQASPFKQNLLHDFFAHLSPEHSDEISEDGSSDTELESSADGDESLLFSGEQRAILGRLKRRLKTARKAFIKQNDQIPDQHDVELAEQKARLLQTFAYLVREGDHELKLSCEATGLDHEVTIELNPERGVGPNLELLFKQCKKLEKARRLGLERERQNSQELSQLEDDIAKLGQESLNDVDLDLYYKRYRLPRTLQQTNTKSRNISLETAKPFKTYLSSTGHLILVGKGPHENDQLTKSAKSNDYWLHAAGATGSHVIIPSKQDIREQLPEALLNEAAILALHYSKFKANLAGETYVARKGDIKKRKGMAPGLWNVERCKTLFFRYNQQELEEVLNRLQF